MSRPLKEESFNAYVARMKKQDFIKGLKAATAVPKRKNYKGISSTSQDKSLSEIGKLRYNEAAKGFKAAKAYEKLAPIPPPLPKDFIYMQKKTPVYNEFQKARFIKSDKTPVIISSVPEAPPLPPGFAYKTANVENRLKNSQRKIKQTLNKTYKEFTEKAREEANIVREKINMLVDKLNLDLKENVELINNDLPIIAKDLGYFGDVKKLHVPQYKVNLSVKKSKK